MDQASLQNPSHSDFQAMVALCTPRGSGAIALIRVSGGDAITIAASVSQLSSGTTLVSAATHTIHHGYVIDSASHERIDEVLFLLMRAPRTFTGEDTVEITCHNNPFIIDRIINAVIAAGGRSAQPGEFTRRAFLNGKVDLVQAESINDLIHAQTEHALKQSMAQLQGSLSQALVEFEKQLVHLLGYIEASFEFLDEEQRDLDFDEAIRSRVANLKAFVAQMRKSFAHQKYIRDGVRIALVGSVNVGKSTLFNTLVGHDRAIVTDIPGTTRDAVETSVYNDGAFWLLVDTAGIRPTNDIVEQQGIERSFQQAAHADIVLVVMDATRPMSAAERAAYDDLMQRCADKVIVVVNKIDALDPLSFSDPTLATAHSEPVEGSHPSQVLSVSAKNKTGIAQLRSAITEKMNNLFSQAKSPYLLNQRQFNLLTEIEVGLEGIANECAHDVHYELLAYRVKDLLEKLSQLTGKGVTEQILDMVFGEFCVGK